MFRRSPSRPEQVKAHLKELILGGAFEAGRIPSEARLASELSVSRNTVRDALSRLEMEGVVTRRQGAGTFVNENVSLVKTRLEQILPYEDMIREQGYRPEIQLRRASEAQADARTVSLLSLEPGEKLLEVEKLFLADDQPVILTVTQIPAMLIVRAYEQADLTLPVYEFFSLYTQQEIAYYLSEIVPLEAPGRLRDLLQIDPANRAMITFEEICLNSENRPLARAVSFFRNELLHLRMIRRLA